MVIGEHRALTLQKIEKVRHLFEIGRNIWIVAKEMRVIELHVDDVLNLPFRRIERAGVLGPRYASCASEQYANYEQ